MVAGKGGVIQADDIDEIQKLNPNISLSHVENAGHMIPWDDEQGFYQAFGDFLDQSII